MLFWAIFKWDRDVRLCNQSICCPLTIIQLFIESHNGMIIIIYYCLFLSLAICFAYCNEFIFFIMKTTEWRITPSDQTWNIDCEAKNNWKKLFYSLHAKMVFVLLNILGDSLTLIEFTIVCFYYLFFFNDDARDFMLWIFIWSGLLLFFHWSLKIFFHH